MRSLSIAPIALLAACTGEPEQFTDGNETDAAVVHGRPAPRPPAPTPEAGPPLQEQSEQAAAAQTLRRYFDLIESGRHTEAADLWWDQGQATAFAARLRRLGDFRPNIAAPQRPEGAAGSVYVSVSLQLLRNDYSLSDGTAVLRRVNDVPGSTAEQRRWRIDRITLQPPPVPLPNAPTVEAAKNGRIPNVR